MKGKCERRALSSYQYLHPTIKYRHFCCNSIEFSIINNYYRITNLYPCSVCMLHSWVFPKFLICIRVACTNTSHLNQSQSMQTAPNVLLCKLYYMLYDNYEKKEREINLICIRQCLLWYSSCMSYLFTKDLT